MGTPFASNWRKMTLHLIRILFLAFGTIGMTIQIEAMSEMIMLMMQRSTKS